MFTFVSAFPKSLHCTDEAQQAETVLSAVLSIYIYELAHEKRGVTSFFQNLFFQFSNSITLPEPRKTNRIKKFPFFSE